jgi:hypothetical protein
MQQKYALRLLNKTVSEVQTKYDESGNQVYSIEGTNIEKLNKRLYRYQFQTIIPGEHPKETWEAFVRQTRRHIVNLHKTPQKIKTTLEIADAIALREELNETDIGKTLSKIMERKSNKAKLDKVVITDENGNVTNVETRPEEVKRLIKDQYEQHWHGKRPADRELLTTERWAKHYSPLPELDETIYKGLMDPVKMPELQHTIASFPEKATGATGVSAKLLQNCGEGVKSLLLELVNKVLKHQIMPSDWLKATIYPIPKTTEDDWKSDINKTRPIALLEIARKICLKIPTDRLTKAMTKHNVLKGQLSQTRA